jgi:hypothetical protein
MATKRIIEIKAGELIDVHCMFGFQGHHGKLSFWRARHGMMCPMCVREFWPSIFHQQDLQALI